MSKIVELFPFSSRYSQFAYIVGVGLHDDA